MHKRRFVARGIRLSLAVVIVANVSCADQSEPSGPATVVPIKPTQSLGESSRREFPSVRRIDLQLSATGTFRPGTPIFVTARLDGRRPASNVDLELVALDEDPNDAPRAASETRQLTASQGALTSGGSRQTSASIQYSRPGYYRVAALARATPEVSDANVSSDTTVLNASYEIVWIRVAETGGGVTNGPDAAAIPPGMIPLFGSYGPFVQRASEARAKGAGQVGTSNPGFDDGERVVVAPAWEDENGSDVDAVNGGTALTIVTDVPEPTEAVVTTGEIWVTGYFKSQNLDVAPPNNLAPIAGSVISALCVGRSSPFVEDYDMVEPVTSHTGFNGYFSVNCPTPPYVDGVWDYIDGTAFLRDSDVNVTGPSAAPAGASFSGTHGSHHEIRAANDYAAVVYKNLHANVQTLFSKFGRTRSRANVEVHPTAGSFGADYLPSSDLVRMNYLRAFDGPTLHDGLFLALHEYAHAFHYLAVEPPGSYSCSPPEHGYTELENLDCAMVEGIADFIAFWTIGSTTSQWPYGGDYGLENNDAATGAVTNPVGGDGVRVEAAVAAFLYDLVDGSTELDSPINTIGPSETHDDLSVPASWLLDVIQHCRLGPLTAIAGADHLVYCLEKSVSAWPVADALSLSWRQATSVDFTQPVATYDAAKIRTLWRYNMFGVYP